MAMKGVVVSVLGAAVLAIALSGATVPVKALDLKDCQDVTPVMSQKKCLDANTKVIASAIIGAVYKRCKSDAQAAGNEGSAAVLLAMICTQDRLLELYQDAGG